MDIIKAEINEVLLAIVHGQGEAFGDAQGALDFIMTAQYQTGARRIVLPKACLSGAFFDLSTRLAGETLQKFINYHFKLAIWGDFSAASPALQAFIAESNRGRDIFFCPDEASALSKLIQV